MKRRNQEREYDEEDRDSGVLSTKSLAAAGEDILIEKETGETTTIPWLESAVLHNQKGVIV